MSSILYIQYFHSFLKMVPGYVQASLVTLVAVLEQNNYTYMFVCYRRYREKADFRDVSWSDKHCCGSANYQRRCGRSILADAVY